MRPAIFIDRDGTLCENRADYVKSIDELKIFPFTYQAIRYFANLDTNPYIFIITNQAAIGKGLLVLETAVEINYDLVKHLEKGGAHVDMVYICPHVPEEGCKCRKPGSAMVHRAISDHPDIDINKMAFIGDQESDLISYGGIRSTYFLVKSGLPISPNSIRNKNVIVADNILELTKMMANGKVHKTKIQV